MKKAVLLVDAFCAEGQGSYVVSQDLAKGLPEFGWRVITTSSSRGRASRVLDMMRTAVSRRNDYELAHISLYSGAAFCWAEMVAQAVTRTKHPFVLTLHGGKLPQFAAVWPRRVRRLFSAAQTITCPSKYLSGEMARYGAAILQMPNPLNLGTYAFRLRNVPLPRMIWVRALHEVYRPELAVRVLSSVRQFYPEATLTMVGPDKGDGSLQRTLQLAGRLGVTDALRITGPVRKHEIPALLANADIFLNTSAVDNTPVSVLEAMACGLCVVSTNAGGLPHLLQSGVDSIMVPVDDGEAMAASVLGLISKGDKAAEISRQARQKALLYDTRQILPKWDDLLLHTMILGAA